MSNGSGLAGAVTVFLGVILVLILIVLPFLLIIGVIVFLALLYMESKARKRILEERANKEAESSHCLLRFEDDNSWE